MVRTFSLAIIGLIGAGAVLGQVKKQFTVDNQEDCQTVDLILKAKTGNCFIRSSQTSELLNIYSNQNLEEYAQRLFQFFRDCDAAGITVIYCEAVSETGLGLALMDRLRRAAHS